MIKSRLRKTYLTKRQMLSRVERERMSAKIASNLFSEFDLRSVRFVHCFIPIERFNEVDTRPVFQRIWEEFPQIQTLVPKVDHQTEELESLKYGHDVELVRSRWQIDEPSYTETVDAEKIDVVVVPLLCFDLSGHRVGYGKGYYDRFLKKCRPDCLTIGLSFFEPVGVIEDSDQHDIRLDYAIVPDRVFDFTKETQRFSQK